MIRVFLTGKHAHRTPLSYRALDPLWADTIRLVDQPDQADLYLFSHVLDIREAPREVVLDWRRRRCPVVLLSEEPFWDTIWGRRPLDPLIYVDTPFGDLPVVQINHQTSSLFHFETIPYYLLTNPRFERTYTRLFRRNMALSADAWQAAFAARQDDIVYMFERRPEPFHDVAWPQGDVIGLCAWRTRLAEAKTETNVVRLGRSWQEGVPRRQELADWYQDKIDSLDGRARILGSLENTHQPHYITEKFFDAFACGAVPIYYASPTHRIHTLSVPSASWINLFGLTPQEGARRLAEWRVSTEIMEAYREAQQCLGALLGTSANWNAERDRLARALPADLQRVLEEA
ncbi:MAG: hypothetical protein GJ677_02520 [Rhodobacteraceae bacterium]|nr:hypothetical protein [Paracoccaceae bacterium]